MRERPRGRAKEIVSISGLVIHTLPDRTRSVRSAIAGMTGVEVHATTEDGRLVVTVDEPDPKRATDTLVALNGLDGVLNAALVYNYFEHDAGEKEETQ